MKNDLSVEQKIHGHKSLSYTYMPGCLTPYTKTGKVLTLVEGFFSHEFVRRWYKIGRELFDVDSKTRRAVAVDKTKVK